MRFTLKDYQTDAVAEVLRNLADGRDDFHRKRRPVAFSLTATTGAGKTVMAAAAIEALFYGSDEFGFEADPGAVVLWFTDDPALNEQTRTRLMESGDSFARSRLEVIETSFNQQKLDPGKVYFLNAQKLSRNSLLVKGAPETEDDALLGGESSPDLRTYTFWDTLRNTISDDSLTLYLILDEAHRGMRARTSRDAAEKSTIVARLVNGAHGVPPVPVVWGISATVERFNVAMQAAEGRLTYPSIVVDPRHVQESGLIKDDIRLDIPKEPGRFDTVLLKRATRKVRESTGLWDAYTEAQGLDSVAPLLVVQVPNTPSNDLLLSAYQTVTEEWPELPADAVAHVFGDHAPINVGGQTIPYISPERVQDRRSVRVLFAKDAISTGWDCPRAEVLVSFRPAKDETHITQLLGRMVRTPLARRVPGDDRLNAVECVLPHFNRKTATEVAEVLLGRRDSGDDGSGGSGGGDGRRVLVNPVDMTVNEAITDATWAAFDRTPTQSLPRRTAKPLKRLSALAQLLASDGLRPGARKDAYAEMFSVFDGLTSKYKQQVEDATYSIFEVEGETIVAGVSTNRVAVEGKFVEFADERSVEAEFRAAGRMFGLDLARRYAEHLAGDDDDDLFDAHIKVAALARVSAIPPEVERAASDLVSKWLTEYRVAIKGLADERRAAYDDVISMTRTPQRLDVLRPRVRAEPTEDSEGKAVDTRPLHLMSDEAGEFPIAGLNSWEVDILDAELARPDIRGWYRNPARGSDDSVSVAYIDAKGSWRRMCPDFLFFTGPEDDVKVSIVDPHGWHLSDALPKLRGLAGYAVEFADEVHRVEAVARMRDGKVRVLDLTLPNVRSAIDDASDAETLYLSDLATDF